MYVACYLEPTKHHAGGWMRAFAEGCEGKVIKTGRRDLLATDHAVMGNWPVAQALIAELGQHGVWYLDSAYIQGAVTKMLRIERNRFWPDQSRNHLHTMDRALSMGVEIKPWRQGGRHVLIALHGPKFGRPWSIDIAAWHATIEARVRAVTDRPIVIREKPYSPEAMARAVPLDEQLADAWCLVTHSSTIGVLAALAGVPVFCEPTCAAATVGCTDLSRIETPVRPEREGWIAALAWRQWSRAEMTAGEAWAHVKDER